ncbi:MAG: hypothetical protein KDA47_02565 [Planctomycetales bacterium]|nr:hypothetical protein [Planctomycetales bacterium]
MLRGFLAAWIIVAMNLSSVTVVHAHEQGDRQHQHFIQPDPIETPHARQTKGEIATHELHAHVWLFGVELHLPMPESQSNSEQDHPQSTCLRCELTTTSDGREIAPAPVTAELEVAPPHDWLLPFEPVRPATSLSAALPRPLSARLATLQTLRL